MLDVKRLTCERDDRILFTDLNFSVHPGQVFQIEGVNGSGKTTLLRILCGLNTDFSGCVFWKGVDCARDFSVISQDLLYLGHHPGIKTSLTPLENLAWFKALHARASGDAVMALDAVGLRGYEDIPCALLSAGQQRRVALARLYLSQAVLWILDEPFTALDKTGVGNKERLMADHARRGGVVILTTHHNLKLPDMPVRGLHLDS